MISEMRICTEIRCRREMTVSIRLTPQRWRRSLLVSEAVPPTITINGGTSPPTGRTLEQLELIKAEICKVLDTDDEF